jgi:hypothetical protein
LAAQQLGPLMLMLDTSVGQLLLTVRGIMNWMHQFE